MCSRRSRVGWLLSQEVRLSPRIRSLGRAFLALAGLTFSITPALANHALGGPGPAVIAAQSTATYICPSNPCVTLPVTLNRSDTTPVLGFSVTF